jgi:tetratricopeptide (TPR) repeat protein
MRGGAVDGEHLERTPALAIELYPAYAEALDQRAFAFMELGLHQQALRDLDESLYLNPDGMTALFCKGECLMKLGHLDEAEAIFTEGQQRFPEHAGRYNEFLKPTRAFALTGRPA